MSSTPQPLIYDLEVQDDSRVLQPKTMFAGDVYGGQALLVVEQDDISIFAAQKNGISVSEEFGVSLAGPIRFVALPDQMSFGGGYWRLDPRHLATIPSTTATPIPLLAKATPDLLQAKDDIDSQLSYLESNSDIGL